MLDGCPYALALDSTYVASGDLPGQERIFGVILEVSAAQRVALDVDTRGKQHVNTIFKNLIADRLADLLNK